MKKLESYKMSDNSSIVYDENKILGRGRYGSTVHKGRFGNRDVAVKRVFPEVASNEFETLKHLDVHEYIVRYFCLQSSERHDYIFIVMELCDMTLNYWVKDKTFNISPLEVLRQLSVGLTWLHKNGVVHRDLKPENVMLVVGKTIAVKIADFGSSLRVEDCCNSEVGGTSGWMAPEILIHTLKPNMNIKFSYASDVFALGLLYYFVLTDGKHAFGDAMRITKNILDRKSSISAYDIVHGCCQNINFITEMISNDPKSRPSCSTVLSYPLFWPEDRKVEFLEQVVIYADDSALKEIFNEPQNKVCKAVHAPKFEIQKLLAMRMGSDIVEPLTCRVPHLYLKCNQIQALKKYYKPQTTLGVSGGRKQFNVDSRGIKIIATKNGIPLREDNELQQLDENFTYEENNQLGKGTYGIVFKGKLKGSDIAVKRIPNAEETRNILQEVEVFMKYEHKNIVKYLCTKTDKHFIFIGLELCNMSLNDWIASKSIDISHVEVLKQITVGLDWLHSKNIIHKDLKPENVLLTHMQAKVQISDFGVTKNILVGWTCSTIGKRKQIWLANEILEQISKEDCRGDYNFAYSFKTDVFALGLLYYFVLTDGKHAFGDAIRSPVHILDGNDKIDNQQILHVCSHHAIFTRLMISRNPDSRPSCTALLSCPLFWSSDRCVEFFEKFYSIDELENEACWKDHGSRPCTFGHDEENKALQLIQSLRNRSPACSLPYAYLQGQGCHALQTFYDLPNSFEMREVEAIYKGEKDMRTAHLVVGNDPCTYVEICNVLCKCKVAVAFWSKLEEIAICLDIPEDKRIEVKRQVSIGTTSYFTLFHDILVSWRGKKADSAKLNVLLDILKDKELKECADDLRRRFTDSL